MDRKQRDWNPFATYHVTCRGNRRDAIFMDDFDIRTYLFILSKLHEKFNFKLLSYCLMTNHLHLLVQSPHFSLSSLMGQLNKRYATYFNNRYSLTGHVFENRFFSKEAQGPQGILEISRYIHRNPLEANMVESCEDYRWSSYFYLYDNASTPPPYLFVKDLPNYFAHPEQRHMKNYMDFVKKERDRDFKYIS